MKNQDECICSRLVKPDKGGYRLIEKLTFIDFVVPKDFWSNGASVPRIFWIVLPPFHPDYLIASIVHDYLCKKKQYALADKYYNALLKKSLYTKKWRRLIIILAVRAWHFIAYNGLNPRYLLKGIL